MNIVTVPDLSAAELIALTKRGVMMFGKEVPLPYLCSDYEGWDFYRGLDGSIIPGRGMTFEVMLWKPELNANGDGCWSSPVAVREHFRKLDFYGHTGAFIEWRRTCGVQGEHATILDNNHALFHPRRCHPVAGECRYNASGCSHARRSAPYSGGFHVGMSARQISHLSISNGLLAGPCMHYVAFRAIT